MTRAIQRYTNKIKNENIERKYIKQGSTFFNTGYIDYLDNNFVEQIENDEILLGENKKVKMKKREYNNLINLFGENKIQEWVFSLDAYCFKENIIFDDCYEKIRDKCNQELSEKIS